MCRDKLRKRRRIITKQEARPTLKKAEAASTHFLGTDVRRIAAEAPSTAGN
jgi:hypothetical protein